MARETNVLIAGGGFAGLTLAIALRQALGPSFAVTVADPALGKSHADDERASAIVAAARRLFATLGVWDAVSAEAQPILDMVVTDSRLDDAMQPVFLTFAGEVEPGEPFAHMIENRFLVAALAEKAEAEGVTLLASGVVEVSHDGERVVAELKDGIVIGARLLAAADGARSTIRANAGIATHGWTYDQSAIVTTVGHERDHGGRAEEHFLPAGPFAILPLTGNRSSIVWTETKGEAERIVALPDDAFMPSSRNASSCISARSTRSARAACIRWDFSSPARSSPSVSRSSATPPMSSIRSPGRGSIWD